jgi:hypothetical protein
MATEGGLAMKIIGAAILGATALMVATAASAREPVQQDPNQLVPSLNQQTEAPYYTPPPPPVQPAWHPLFTIAGFDGRLWAPIEPHYDANNNRNLAANPLWRG